MKQLRFTTTKPLAMAGLFAKGEDLKPLTLPENIGKLDGLHDIKGDGAYIHNDAEILAGFDIPTFIDGDLTQLDLPQSKQNILMLLPTGQYECVAKLQQSGKYYITLKK